MANFNGSSGDDIYTGGVDRDSIVGNGGNDTLSGNGENDTIGGNAGADQIDGGDGSDMLFTGDVTPNYTFPYLTNFYMPPVLDTGSDADTVHGGGGDDIIFAGYGDSVDGGDDGQLGDFLYISFKGAPTGVTVDFSQATQTVGGGTITGIENIAWIQGSDYDDTIYLGGFKSIGSSDPTPVFAGAGNDHVVAGRYTGMMYGEAGDDFLDGRASPFLIGIDGGDGNDTIYTTSNNSSTAYGGNGNDTITGGGWVYGGSGDDYVYRTWTGTHVDGGAGYDVVDYSLNPYGVVATTDANNPLIGIDVLIGFEQVLGSTHADTLSGGAADELLAGNEGADSIRGNGGADIITGGVGADTIDGGDGNDHLYGQSATGGSDDADSISGGNGIDYLQGNAGNDTIDGGAQADRINGGADNDQISGGDGNDVVNGNLGSDTIDGGTGSDSLRGGQGDDQIQGGDGNDTLGGDLGSDKLTGGVGADLFRFAGSDSNAGGGIRDEITDFTHGSDHIGLPFAPAALLIGSAADQAGAVTVANALMADHAGFQEAALIQVGADTYLFASTSGGTDNADLMIRLDAVTATQIVSSDFV